MDERDSIYNTNNTNNTNNTDNTDNTDNTGDTSNANNTGNLGYTGNANNTGNSGYTNNPNETNNTTTPPSFGSPYQSQPGSGYGNQPLPPNYQYQSPKKPKKGGPGTGGWIAIILSLVLIFGSLAYGGVKLMEGQSGLNFPSSSQSEVVDDEKEASDNDRSEINDSDAASKDKDRSDTEASDKEASDKESSDKTADKDTSSSSSSGAVSVGSLDLVMAKGNESTLTIPEVAKKTADSVVEITTETVTTSQMMQQYISSGAGSGVIFTEDGYIVTNNHVIEGASHITVTLHNGESYDATLVGTDDEKDVALLKIDAKGLTPVTIGNSDDLVVGQTIIVVGNPLGQLGGSVTHGIVSAMDRDITISGQTMNLLQIDAAVNPGNSGGALFDEKGNLVGIVNAKSSGEDIEGIGFAIPVNNALQILDDLQQYGYVRGRASLGVTLVDISSQQTAWMYGVNETGVYIYSVNEGLSADKAGLRPGDRIVSVNGTECQSSADVKTALSDISVGDEITVVVSRNGEKQTIKVTVGEYVPSELRDHTTSQNQ